MEKKKHTGAKVFLTIFILLILIIAGIGGLFYYLANKLIIDGNVLNGDWTGEKYSMQLDADEKTYTLTPAGGEEEKGTIEKLEYDKDKSGDKSVIYNVTLTSNGESYDAVFTMYQEKSPVEMTVTSDHIGDSFTVTEIVDK